MPEHGHPRVRDFGRVQSTSPGRIGVGRCLGRGRPAGRQTGGPGTETVWDQHRLVQQRVQPGQPREEHREREEREQRRQDHGGLEELGQHQRLDRDDQYEQFDLEQDEQHGLDETERLELGYGDLDQGNHADFRQVHGHLAARIVVRVTDLGNDGHRTGRLRHGLVVPAHRAVATGSPPAGRSPVTTGIVSGHPAAGPAKVERAPVARGSVLVHRDVGLYGSRPVFVQLPVIVVEPVNSIQRDRQNRSLVKAHLFPIKCHVTREDTIFSRHILPSVKIFQLSKMGSTLFLEKFLGNSYQPGKDIPEWGKNFL